jgi:hypothetical protein
MKNISLKSVIPLTQDEIAMLFGISRSQWSMYDLGLRDLPLEPKTKLITLLKHLKSAKKASPKSKKIQVFEESEAKKGLQYKVACLEFERQLLDRKILTTEKKRAESFAALEVVQFMESENNTEMNATLLKFIASRAEKVLERNTLEKIITLKIEKEQMEALKLSLEEKINKKSLL